MRNGGGGSLGTCGFKNGPGVVPAEPAVSNEGGWFPQNLPFFHWRALFLHRRALLRALLSWCGAPAILTLHVLQGRRSRVELLNVNFRSQR